MDINMIKGYRDKTGLYIHKEFFTTGVREIFTLKNLKKDYAKLMGVRNWNKLPDEIKYYEKVGDYYKVPVGFYGQYPERFEDKYVINNILQPEFLGELYEDQKQKVDLLLQKDIGFMYATTGVGKGVMIPYIASKLNCKTLIIVPGLQLLNEMVERFQDLLGITPVTIGGKAQSKKTVAYDGIVVATIDSIIKQDTSMYDAILVDEMDKIVQSEKRQEFMNKLSPKYLYGFTGTLNLNHIDDRLLNIYFGNKIDFIKKNFIPNVYNIHTEYKSDLCYDDTKEFVQLNTEILLDEVRNNLIASTIKNSVSSSQTKHDLVLTNRIDQLGILEDKLNNLGIKTFIIKGDYSKEDREKIITEFEESESAVLLGSAQILSRGFDCPILQSVHLIYPCKFQSLVVQSCGRILRKYEGKTYCDIYNYSDTLHPFLHRQSNSRLRAMKKEYGKVNIVNIIDGTKL